MIPSATSGRTGVSAESNDLEWLRPNFPGLNLAALDSVRAQRTVVACLLQFNFLFIRMVLLTSVWRPAELFNG